MKREIIRILGPAVAVLTLFIADVAGQPSSPEVIDIQSGGLTLRAQLWRPSGSGRFPAVLFNHGSYGANDRLSPSDAEKLGSVCLRDTAMCFYGCIAKA